MRRINSQFDDQRVSASPATPSCCCCSCCCCCIATSASVGVATREAIVSGAMRDGSSRASVELRSVVGYLIVPVSIVIGVVATTGTKNLLVGLGVAVCFIFAVLQGLWTRGMSRTELSGIGLGGLISVLAEVLGAAFGLISLGSHNINSIVEGFLVLLAVSVVIPLFFVNSTNSIDRLSERARLKKIGIAILISLSCYVAIALFVLAISNSH